VLNNKLTIIALMSMLSLMSTPALNAASEKPDSASSATSAEQIAAKLPSGLYLVKRQSRNQKSLGPIAPTETLLSDDYHFLEPAEREPVRYLVLQTRPFIALTLGADPTEDKEDGTGKPRLQLQLTEDQKGPLEEFTKSHLGETVAIVIAGEIVTTHKVKSAITGGRLQVTRCTEHGCETLFSKLLKKQN
jgi:hypothetical protein